MVVHGSRLRLWQCTAQRGRCLHAVPRISVQQQPQAPLLYASPSPQFKPEVLAAMFQAADEEEQAAKLVVSGGRCIGAVGAGP